MKSKTEETPMSLMDAANVLEANPKIIWVRINANPQTGRDSLDLQQDARCLGLRLEFYGEKIYAVRE